MSKKTKRLNEIFLDEKDIRQHLPKAVKWEQIVWHGSDDIRWIDENKAFNGKSYTKNCDSQYLFVSPSLPVAQTYAGISEIQREKANIGLGSKPKEYAGVRPFQIKKGAKVYQMKNLHKQAKELGISLDSNTYFEEIFDKLKELGYQVCDNTKLPGANELVLLDMSVLVKIEMTI